jgi:hypothetical protein
MEPKDLDYGPPLAPVLIQINLVHPTPSESLLFLFKFVFIYALTGGWKEWMGQKTQSFFRKK